MDEDKCKEWLVILVPIFVLILIRVAADTPLEWFAIQYFSLFYSLILFSFAFNSFREIREFRTILKAFQEKKRLLRDQYKLLKK